MNISKTFTFGSLGFLGAGGIAGIVSYSTSHSSQTQNLINEASNLIKESEILINSSESLKKELETETQAIRNKLAQYKGKSYMYDIWYYFLSVCREEVQEKRMNKQFGENKKLYEDYKEGIKEWNTNDNDFENILQALEESKKTVLKITEKENQFEYKENKFERKLYEIENSIEKKFRNYKNDEDIKKFNSLIQGIGEVFGKKSQEKKSVSDLENQILSQKQALENILESRKFKNIQKELKIWSDLSIQLEKISFFKFSLKKEIMIKKD